MTTTLTQEKSAAAAFGSFVELQQANLALLEENVEPNQGSVSSLQSKKVIEFIGRSVATGAILQQPSERKAAQPRSNTGPPPSSCRVSTLFRRRSRRRGRQEIPRWRRCWQRRRCWQTSIPARHRTSEAKCLLTKDWLRFHEPTPPNFSDVRTRRTSFRSDWRAITLSSCCSVLPAAASHP